MGIIFCNYRKRICIQIKLVSKIFDFGQEAEVLMTEVLTTSPTSIKSRVHFAHNLGKVMLKPLLLNSKDSILFKVLLKEIGLLDNKQHSAIL